MNRTIQYVTFFLLFAALFAGCEEKIVYEDNPGVGSIYVDGVTDNTVHLYAGETFQVEMNIQPSDAKLDGPVLYLYKSGNERVFTVDAKGLIRGGAAGEAVLQITLPNYPALKTVAMVAVTDKVHPVTEIKIDDRLKNLSVGVGDEIEIGKYITILPENASNKEYTLQVSNKDVLAVTESGSVKALALGEATVTIKAKDGSNVSAICSVAVKEPAYSALDRSKWTVTTSHNLPVDNAIKNAPESLIDGSIATCLSMVKPGKSYAGVSVSADEDVFFIIDMKEKSAFNYFKIFHRTSNTQLYLRVWGVSLLGSNDGETFEVIRQNILVEYDGVNHSTVRMMDKLNYRYLKVLYTDWDPKSGSTAQIAEFELGTFGF